MTRSIFRKIPLLLWCTLIFYLSSQQAVSVSDKQTVDTFAHKLAHVIEYCILYILFVYGFSSSKYSEYNRKVWYSGIVFVVMYGISDEIHQSFVPTRGPRATDVLFDALGGIIGYFLIQFRHQVSSFK